jgi:hypothetical protein
MSSPADDRTPPPAHAATAAHAARGVPDAAAAHKEQALHADQDPGPPPIQFSLKTLLLWTTIAGGLFALLSRVNSVWAAIVVWVSLLVAGHVVGNAVGTHGRDRARFRRGSDDGLNLHTTTLADPRSAAAPTTTLGHNAGLGLRLFVLVGCGAVVGSLSGTTLVWFHNDRQLNGPALLLAACSSAVVGAFLTFLAASCLQVWSKAWRAASRHSADD